MKALYITSFSALLLAVTVAIPSATAQAEMSQQQSQNVSQSSNFSFSCTGNCGSSSASYSSSSNLDQSQSQRVGWGDYAQSNGKQMYGKKNTKPSNGRITVGWEFEDGTCYVRYTEASSSADTYKWSTSTACSNGEITIGRLRRGTVYRFQVKQNDGEWSDPTTMRAY